MENIGHIRLHRRLLNSKVFAHETALKIWIWCLLKATHKNRFATIQIGRGMVTVDIKQGQFIFGRHRAEEELGIDGSTIYRWINKFASEEYECMISLNVNNQYTIITVCNWVSYQIIEDGDEQPTNNQRTTNAPHLNNQCTTFEPHLNTDNNDNNVNNDIIINNNTELENSKKSWKEDFNVYLSELNLVYDNLILDQNFIKEQEQFYPEVDIVMSLKKAYTNFWRKESGWKFKKKKRIKTIDWKDTLTNAIGLNKVYKKKQTIVPPRKGTSLSDMREILDDHSNAQLYGSN